MQCICINDSSVNIGKCASCRLFCLVCAWMKYSASWLLVRCVTTNSQSFIPVMCVQFAVLCLCTFAQWHSLRAHFTVAMYIKMWYVFAKYTHITRSVMRFFCNDKTEKQLMDFQIYTRNSIFAHFLIKRFQPNKQTNVCIRDWDYS